MSHFDLFRIVRVKSTTSQADKVSEIRTDRNEISLLVEEYFKNNNA